MLLESRMSSSAMESQGYWDLADVGKLGELMGVV